MTQRRLDSTSARRGFSLAEASVATIIIGVMMVAAMNTVGASKAGQFQIDLSRRGEFLAEELMGEIMAQDFRDVGVSDESIGNDAGDGVVGRTGFDDVDDYADWSGSPPTTRKGEAMSGFDGWARSVHVRHVLANDFDSAVASETGVKRITVTVSYANRIVASLESIRTDAWTHYRAGRAQPTDVRDLDVFPTFVDALTVFPGGG